MPQSTFTFQQTLFIAVPASKLWEALTTPEFISRYYLCPLQILEPHPGGRISYGDATQPFITGKILTFEPDKCLRHSFLFIEESHQPNGPDPESRVTYDLRPMGEMCELTLTHDGFTSENQTYANISGGWPVILSSLKTLLETGKSLPWPKR